MDRWWFGSPLRHHRNKQREFGFGPSPPFFSIISLPGIGYPAGTRALRDCAQKGARLLKKGKGFPEMWRERIGSLLPNRWKYQWRYWRRQTPWDTQVTPPAVWGSR